MAGSPIELRQPPNLVHRRRPDHFRRPAPRQAIGQGPIVHFMPGAGMPARHHRIPGMLATRNQATNATAPAK